MNDGQIDQAIIAMSKAVIAEPENRNHQTSFGQAVKYQGFQEVTPEIPEIKQAVQICLAAGNVSSLSFINAWTCLLWLDEDFKKLMIPAQQTYVQGRIPDFVPEEMAAQLNDPFLLSGLKYLMVCNIMYERLFVCLRRYFLRRDGYDPETFLPFLCALAEQCNLNEYIYACTDEEREKVESLEKELNLSALDSKTMAQIALIGCYKDLSLLAQAKGIENAADVSQSGDFIHLVDAQITGPLKVRTYYDDIPSLAPLENETSEKVARQYEENPYPRWRHIDIPEVSDEQAKASEGKDILVAGCATGQEPMNMALQYPNAKVLGVDLSIPSIAYAKYKADELGVGNIEFMQADILDLDKLDRKFDLIICVGVLHHMADPIVGWRKLLAGLKPGGAMKIALYSEAARQAVVQCREWIAQQGFAATPEGISDFRQAIMRLEQEHPLKKILGAVDFFSLSMCRDLVFHVQEHRFTLPQLKDILDDLDLSLITMALHNSKDLAAYKSMFPDDPDIKNLDGLNEYEQKNPETFRTMYSFWCRKKGGGNNDQMPEWL